MGLPHEDPILIASEQRQSTSMGPPGQVVSALGFLFSGWGTK